MNDKKIETSIKKLRSISKGSIGIYIDDHKAKKKSVQDYLSWKLLELEDSMVKEMIKKDSIIVIQIHSKISTERKRACHHDLALAVDQMIELLTP